MRGPQAPLVYNEDNIMSMTEFIIAYIIIMTLMPIMEKLTELLLGVINLGLAHVSLAMTYVRADVERVNKVIEIDIKDKDQSSAIGFDYTSADED